MFLRDAPAFSRVRVADFGTVSEIEDVVLENGIDDEVAIWTRCVRAANPFATVEMRGVLDRHAGIAWLPDDAQIQIVQWPRYAGRPEVLADSAEPVEPPEGSRGSVATPQGWPRLIWNSDLVFTPVQGWDDPQTAVETLLCALTVAPYDEPGLRPMLLAALKARLARVTKDPRTYPPEEFPWLNRTAPGNAFLEYLRG